MKKSTSNLIVGFLAGAAAGAVLGILYAPDEGSKTRKKIKDKTNHLKDEMEHTFEDLKAQVTGAVDEIKKKVDEVKGETKPPPRKQPSRGRPKAKKK